MEKKLLESHKQCSQIAKDRSQAVKNMTIVEQVQVYQGCVSFVSVFGQMLFFQINRGKPEIQKFSFKKLMYFFFHFFFVSLILSPFHRWMLISHRIVRLKSALFETVCWVINPVSSFILSSYSRKTVENPTIIKFQRKQKKTIIEF